VESAVIASAKSPEGRMVVLTDRVWAHVVSRHENMGEHLDDVLRTIRVPDYREPDVRAGRERFFGFGLGPQRWLRVVIEFGTDRDRVVFHFRPDQRSTLDSMTLTIANTSFDRMKYDEESDVLYLQVSGADPEALTDATPEGHAITGFWSATARSFSPSASPRRRSHPPSPRSPRRLLKSKAADDLPSAAIFSLLLRSVSACAETTAEAIATRGDACQQHENGCYHRDYVRQTDCRAEPKHHGCHKNRDQDAYQAASLLSVT
jgi:hypothetical protein